MSSLAMLCAHQAVAPEPSVWEVDVFVPGQLPHHYAKDTQARERLEFDIEKHRPVRFPPAEFVHFAFEGMTVSFGTLPTDLKLRSF